MRDTRFDDIRVEGRDGLFEPFRRIGVTLLARGVVHDEVGLVDPCLQDLLRPRGDIALGGSLLDFGDERLRLADHLHERPLRVRRLIVAARREEQAGTAEHQRQSFDYRFHNCLVLSSVGMYSVNCSLRSVPASSSRACRRTATAESGGPHDNPVCCPRRRGCRVSHVR